MAVFYGALTEEIIFRWGLSSIVVAPCFSSTPKTAAITMGVVLSAALFAVAHLPAAFAGVEVWQGAAVARTLAWNAMWDCCSDDLLPEGT